MHSYKQKWLESVVTESSVKPSLGCHSFPELEGSRTPKMLEIALHNFEWPLSSGLNM